MCMTMLLLPLIANGFSGCFMDKVTELHMTTARALEIVQEIATNNTIKVVLTNHAKRRMRERKITRKDVLCCLRHGKIISGPVRSEEGNWEIKMSSLEAGEKVNVVAALDRDYRGGLIVVVTTY